MSVALLSIDLAKNIFQLYGVDERGHPVFSQVVSSLSVGSGRARRRQLR
ncbi:hypothetical protein [Paraburkholderia sp. J8-2]|nr:hypothetical protein [Paraburkholderia sp. J8-2]